MTRRHPLPWDARRAAGACLLLPLLLSCPRAPAQGDDPQRGEEGLAWPRSLEYLAPDNSYLWLRVERMDLDLARLALLADDFIGEKGRLEDIIPKSQQRQIRLALPLLKGLVRSPLGLALKSLAAGELAFGLASNRAGRPVPFLLARVADAYEAKRIVKIAKSLWKLDVDRKGPYLLVAPDRGIRRVISERLTIIAKGGQPSTIGRRIHAELESDAAIALWFDLSAQGPGQRLANGIAKLKNRNQAAFLTLGLNTAFGASPYFIAELRPDARAPSLTLTVPGLKTRLSAAARLALDIGPAPRGAPMAALPEHKDTLLRFRLSRNLPAYLRLRKELAGKDAQRGIQNFLQGMDFAFRGRGDFEAELLPDIQAGLAGLVTLARAEDLEKTGPLPYRIPAMLLAFGHGGKKIAAALPQALQMIILSSNNGRKRKGQLPYLVRRKSDKGIKIASATLLPPDGDRPYPFSAGMQPTVASSATHLFIASSEQLCREMVAAAGKPRAAENAMHRGAKGPDDEGIDVLDRLELFPANIAKAIRSNLEGLTLRRVLETGHGFASAERMFSKLAKLFDELGQISLQDAFCGDDFELSLRWWPASTLFRSQEVKR